MTETSNRRTQYMTETSMEETPFTTVELDDREMADLPLPQQVQYAVYNGNHRLSEIVDVVTFGGEWTRDIVDDLVEEGKLVERTSDSGPFYVLPDVEMPRSLTDEEYEKLHGQARREYYGRDLIGDDQDATQVAESTAVSDSEVSMRTEQATDDTVPGPEADAEDVKAAKAKHGGQLPVDRSYDWEAEKLDPTWIAEYFSADNEKEDIVEEIEQRRESGKFAHFCIAGPSGCGKTTLPENITLGMDAPAFVIHCHDGLRPNNLLGMPTYVGDETWWVDGPITKALLASRERPAVLIFDEINRTTSRTLGVIMSVLDHQCQVTLDARGGETVQGDPMNLIVFSTMNQGAQYQVNQLDPAQIRRLGNTYYTDFIGLNNLEKEALLIEKRSPLGRDFEDDIHLGDVPDYTPHPAVEAMLTAANDIRRKANEVGGESNIRMGVPTGTMLEWARTAWTHRETDAELGPFVKAAETSVINPFYRGDEEVHTEVENIIEDKVGGMDLDISEDDFDEVEDPYADRDTIEVSEDTYLFCEECGWYEESEEADSETVVSMECPDCSELLSTREAP